MVILFFIYACIGWCMEVTLKFIQYRRFINRGFLIGPYCPIYGWGAVAVTVLVGGMIGREGTISEIFWAGYVLCGVLEYATSWYMEKSRQADPRRNIPQATQASGPVTNSYAAFMSVPPWRG